ncbi:Uncharacterized protein LSUE1_G002374 [Lachnellula suecica]|uniref:NAD-dependent epimerase/dehydratase domain-containing protein n=1 Tax=Lachnellula suecica TaxID=602035 RepID=A0A8T9CBJ1_9HELO|nr:Uncharacterized protein LSUE1_G002374 [Lachnellula suecica]
MISTKILLTGATGYIGGSILTQLLESEHGFSASNIFVLVRGEDKAKALATKGVNPILFNSLDDFEVIKKAASEHDVIIHTASGFHTESAKALIIGLGERNIATGKAVHYFHTSGTSNLGDQPISGTYHESRTFSDKENIYTYLKAREALQPYPQRTTDIAVVETGLSAGVPTTIIMSPTIYGLGSGDFNRLSIQGPIAMRAAIRMGQAMVIGEGKGIWDYVHVQDLVKLYELLLTKVINGEAVPTGEAGILFSGTGRFSWAEMARGIASALVKVGAIENSEVKSVSIVEAAESLLGDPAATLLAELGLASNSRTSSDIAHELGWREEKTEEDFKKSFSEEAKLVVETLK